jgi:site-specific recombinase XerD
MSDLVLVPDRQEILEKLLLRDVSNAHTRRAYSRALGKFLSWYSGKEHREVSRLVLEEYRTYLERSGASPSSINQELSALRRMLRRAAVAGYLDRDRAADAAGVGNTRALGVRAGNWLTAEQAKKLLLAPDENTLKGKRDRAVLAVLIGCGLRREELVLLNVEDVQMREDRWVIPELLGKGRRVRLVPVPAWVKERLDLWTTNGNIREKRTFRAVRKNGTVSGESLSAAGIWKIVEQYAMNAGIGHLTPHDLRRTCAKLCRANRGDLEQIQYLLGHSSIQTTERYLGGEQKVKKAVNDRLFRTIK